jgi:F-type H+-transporting ATPase subunit beta
MSEKQEGKNRGILEQIIGPVVDIYFENELPALKNALFTENKDGKKITLEVASHLGVNRVRAIAMADTAGLSKGLGVIDSGSPISVPVGEKSLGRLFNVLGETLDDGKDISDAQK